MQAQEIMTWLTLVFRSGGWWSSEFLILVKKIYDL